jgi:hypothetical protein
MSERIAKFYYRSLIAAQLNSRVGAIVALNLPQ